MAATTNWVKPEIRAPKQEFRHAKSFDRQAELKDLRIRLALIPAFGIVIPHLTGLFGPVPASHPFHWLGYLWFIGLSFAIWQGNRALLLYQRSRFDWLHHRWRKVLLLLAANIFYTAPVSVAMLLLWYRAAGFGPDWAAIQSTVLMNVICVIFITHTYETVYLIRQRESDAVAFEKLERARVQAQLAALKSQIDPHFLFNALNTLSALIARDPTLAIRFNEDLADVYRYILTGKERDLVLVEDEIEFATRYFGLLEIRFGTAIRLELPAPGGEGMRWLVPPISLQVLMENAAKHNEFSTEDPLTVRLRLEDGYAVMENNRRPRRHPIPENGCGLPNLGERCRAVTGRELRVTADADCFRVALPMRRLGEEP